MLSEVVDAIDQCSPAERAKLARFAAAQAESNLSERPGVSRILSWVGVVAAGRTPNPFDLSRVPPEDRRYVLELSMKLEAVVRDEAALERANDVGQLEDLASGGAEWSHPMIRVWNLLAEALRTSLG